MKWKRNDPIPPFEQLLREQGATDAQIEERRARARAVNDDALKFAIDSAPPKPETVGDYVFA